MRKLRRYTFEDKIFSAQYYSLKASEYIFLGNRADNYYPWEVEAYILFCFMSGEGYISKSINYSKDWIDLLKLYDEINNNVPLPEKTGSGGYEQYIDKVITRLKLLEFDKQNFIVSHRIYRAYYIYNYKSKVLNLQAHFLDYFGVKFENFACLALTLYTFGETYLKALSDKNNLEYIQSCMELFLKIPSLYPECVRNLSISYDDFINIQKKELPNGLEDIYFSFKYFQQFPFVEKDSKQYLVVPHLVYYACTDSLLFRLTEGNNKLRNLIGKEVMEKYLYKIIDDSFQFDKISKEIKYKDKKLHTERLSPDVIVLENNNIILFEMKLTTSPNALRRSEPDIYEKVYDMFTRHLKQLYTQLLVYNEYDPFNCGIQKDNIYGVVVCLNLISINLNRVYNDLKYKLKLNDEQFTYLLRHIVVLDLSEVESFYLNGVYLLNALRDRSECEDPYSFVFMAKNYIKDSVLTKNNKTMELLQELKVKAKESLATLIK